MSHARIVLEEIKAQARSPLAAVRQAFTASFFTLPTREQLPTPGAARNWDYSDWKKWANPFNVTVESRSTHANTITHTQFRTLFVSLPSTPGDFRGGMASAREIRHRFLEELERLATAVSLAIDDVLPQVEDLEPDVAVTSMRAYVVEHRYDEAFQRRMMKMLDSAARTPTDEMINAAKRARNLLDKVTARYKTSPRTAIQRAIGDNEPVEAIFERIKNGLPIPADLASCLVQGLEDQLEAMDIVEQEEKNTKLREREAKEREKAEKALVSATGAAGYQNAIINFRGDVAEMCRDLVKVTEQHASVLAAKMATLERKSNEFPFPAYPTDQLKELLERTRVAEQAFADANEKLAEALIARDECAARVETLTPELEKLRMDHNAALALFDGVEAGTNWREKYADLVARLIPLLSSDNFMTIAGNLVTARNALKAAQDSIATTAAQAGAT